MKKIFFLPLFLLGLFTCAIFANAADTTAPAIPRGFDGAGGSTAYQMVLTWTNPADSDLDHINVYINSTAAYQAPNVWAAVPAQPNTKGTYTFFALNSGTDYYVYLAAVDTSGNRSAYTAELKRTTASSQDITTPGSATTFSAQDTQSGGSVRLSWTTSSDDDFFQARIYRSGEQGFTPSGTNEIAAIFGIPSSAGTYTDTGLTNGTTYYYRIRTEDNRGNLQTGLFYPSTSATPTYISPSPPPQEEPPPQAQPVIADGDLIRAQGTQDIYIVKIVPSAGLGQAAKKFKRLILNPAIFNSYGHLRWDAVKDVPQARADEFTLSELVMEVNPDGTSVNGKVYQLTSEANSDVGIKRWLNATSAQFEAQYDWNAIYKINHTEAGPNFYPEGSAITS